MTDVASPHVRGPRLKRIVVGRPMANDEYEETLLPKWLALPIFASDPLSSVAYATEAALVVLVGASAGAAHLAFPLSLGIAALLAIVVVSYRQTVRVYQTSGGAYIVAKENLGRLPSLVAAAALLTDYILTVAVSVAAGVLALTSAATSLRGHELTLSIGFVVLIAVANLRGVREAGILFAIPTYAFVTSIFALIIVGFGRGSELARRCLHVFGSCLGRLRLASPTRLGLSLCRFRLVGCCCCRWDRFFRSPTLTAQADRFPRSATRLTRLTSEGYPSDRPSGLTGCPLTD